MHKKTVKRIFINDSMPDAHLEVYINGEQKYVAGLDCRWDSMIL